MFFLLSGQGGLHLHPTPLAVRPLKKTLFMCVVPKLAVFLNKVKRPHHWKKRKGRCTKRSPKKEKIPIIAFIGKGGGEIGLKFRI